MAYPSGTFKASFWETDFLNQNGFETIVTHIKEGQKSCKWLEDYLKQRAKAEDDYSKSLLKISKTSVCEFGSLRKAVDEMKVELETEATLHTAISVKIAEEAAKLAEFREKQREERKKTEDHMHRSHKNKADLYRRMQNCKSTYESRFKAAEKAESDAEKLKFGTKPKEAEKAKKNATQCRSNSHKADDEYKNSVNSVESARQTWVRDHTEACETLQQMEEERIIFLRNTIWVFTNLVSDLCCRLDDSREKIRLVAEKCDEDADIREFISLKSHCTTPLQQVEYISCGSGVGQNSPSLGSQNDSNHGAPMLPYNGSHHIYEVDEVAGSTYTALYDYTPASNDELELQSGDRIKQMPSNSQDSGWLTGLNLRTNITGLFPLNYVQPC